MSKTFEDYLRDIHAEDYTGLDDDMPDDFEEWMMGLSPDKLVELVDKYMENNKSIKNNEQRLLLDIFSGRDTN